MASTSLIPHRHLITLIREGHSELLPQKDKQQNVDTSPSHTQNTPDINNAPIPQTDLRLSSSSSTAQEQQILKESEFAHENQTDQIDVSEQVDFEGIEKENRKISHLKIMQIFQNYYQRILNIFQNYCAFGEPMNTNLLKSAKFIKLLKDSNLIKNRAVI